MLKAIVAISKDGYFARESEDKMNWLGPVDKQVFRILTASTARLGVGTKSAQFMPKKLEGRKLYKLSRFTACNLNWFWTLANKKQGAWLIGGQQLILAAIKEELLTEIHICRSSRFAFPKAGEGIRDALTEVLVEDKRWVKRMETKVGGEVSVECWKFSQP